ncbi:dihydropteroate synthase [Marichromatium bheemlicum]|uniref:Dihydropteroate synthase n=1 Tax=Marichromatium bheemlicum TaxID=365339 RepID=A0ABX1I6N9_9GAMM|nr:dihydropteroate synthase [Marichromatium bheemlicum]NKN33232.1 dihydropteroate synthase [Marichromatium bheemlicum]
MHTRTPAIPPRIMGILNVTPDSFSDGGRHLDPKAAITHGLALAAAGADIIDVGGESTRPGSRAVPAAEQCERVLPVIRALRAELPGAVEISIDTTLAEVARAALDAGANWINDTAAGEDDPGLLALAAENSATLVLMHRRGRPETMQQDPRYDDVVAEVEDYLLERAGVAIAAGVAAERILLDPGIGFGKTFEHNLALIAALGRLRAHGYPVLLGTSRKRFLGTICNESCPTALDAATAATTTAGVLAGIEVFRVHDVAANRQAADVAWALHRAGMRASD